MQTVTSKLTKKYQATIPEPVRKLLQLKAGDALAFDIEGDDVYIRKACAMDMVFAQALNETLGEWASEADQEAYRDL